MKITVVIATYNENDNIEVLIPKILALRDDIGVLIVDDASPDGTGDSAERLARETGKVGVIHRSGKLGLGTALKAGIEKALAEGADLVATMDADHSHGPQYLCGMIDKTREASIVLGSRYVEGGGVVGWTWKRVLLSRVANIYARTITGLNVKDCTTGYRVYTRECLSSIDIENVGAKGFSFLVEILLIAHRKGFTIAEAPIVFTDRVVGYSKNKLDEITGGAIDLAKARFRKTK